MRQIFSSRPHHLFAVAFCARYNLLLLLLDHNYRKRSSSKDILGFPEYPSFSFSEKNRKLWVSWNIFGRNKIKQQFVAFFFELLVASLPSGRQCDSTCIFLLKVIRYGIRRIQVSCWWNVCLSWLYLCAAVCSACELHPACHWPHPHAFPNPVDPHAARRRLHAFLILLYGLLSANSCTSRSCCFWRTRTRCPPHTVSSGCSRSKPRPLVCSVWY